MKTCTRKTCTIHIPQPDTEFLDKHGRITLNCKTCRDKKMEWDRLLKSKLTSPSHIKEIDRYYGAMIIRATNRPEWLIKMMNNG